MPKFVQFDTFYCITTKTSKTTVIRITECIVRPNNINNKYPNENDNQYDINKDNIEERKKYKKEEEDDELFFYK